MKVFVDKDEESDLIVLMSVAESEDAVGDLVKEVRPGETELGKTYAEWSESESPVEIE